MSSSERVLAKAAFEGHTVMFGMDTESMAHVSPLLIEVDEASARKSFTTTGVPGLWNDAKQYKTGSMA